MIDWFRSRGVEVELPTDDCFLKVVETLTRIGVASKREKKLYQSCHLLHKRGRYAVLHFKELFLLDGKEADVSEEDLSRRNMIASLLAEWGLVRIVGSGFEALPRSGMSQVKVVPFREKPEWVLEAKYTVGKKRRVE